MAAATPPSVQSRLEAIARAVFGAGDPASAARVLDSLKLHSLKFWHDPTVVAGLAHAVDERSTDDPDQWSMLRDLAGGGSASSTTAAA